MKINFIIILAITVLANAVPMSVLHADSEENSSSETDGNGNSHERNNVEDDDAISSENESNFTNSILTITENPLESANETDGEPSFFDQVSTWFNNAIESIKDMASYVVNMIFPQDKLETNTTVDIEEIGSTVELITKQPDETNNENETSKMISGEDLKVLLNRASEENEI